MSNISKLRDGQQVIVNGVSYEMVEGKSNGIDLSVGDLYLAERNSGPKVLKVANVVERYGSCMGWVEATDLTAYPYNLHEFVGVRVVE